MEWFDEEKKEWEETTGSVRVLYPFGEQRCARIVKACIAAVNTSLGVGVGVNARVGEVAVVNELICRTACVRRLASTYIHAPRSSSPLHDRAVR